MSSNETQPLSPKTARLVALGTLPVGTVVIWWTWRDFVRIESGEVVRLTAPIHLLHNLFGATGALVTLGLIFVLFALLMLSGAFVKTAPDARNEGRRG